MLRLLQNVGHRPDNVRVIELLREQDGTITGFSKHNEALVPVRFSGGSQGLVVSPLLFSATA
jgi:hypothetical protein